MTPARRRKDRPDPTQRARADEAEAVHEGQTLEPLHSQYPGPAPLELRAWLHSRGVQVAPAELGSLLEAALRALPAELRIDGREELTEPELERLGRAGLDPAPRPGGPDPVAQGVADYAALLGSALDVNEAAERAGVVATRIRQRLNSAPRTLVGVRVDNVWRVPLFQFCQRTEDEGAGLIPGIGEVVKEIDPGAHALAIQRWFLGEHVDLVAGEDEERHLSPRDWLLLGRDPTRVAELAREL